MHSSGILRYDDVINDMDFFTKFKYTTKGPNALGNKNSKNVSIKNRDLHPNYLGYIDCLVCGNSDPGRSGVLSPFSDIKGLYFDESEEPNDFAFKLQNDLKEIFDASENKCYVQLECDNYHDYYDLVSKIQKFTNNEIQCYATSRENQMSIIVESEVNIDEGDNEKKEK